MVRRSRLPAKSRKLSFLAIRLSHYRFIGSESAVFRSTWSRFSGGLAESLVTAILESFDLLVYCGWLLVSVKRVGYGPLSRDSDGAFSYLGSTVSGIICRM